MKSLCENCPAACCRYIALPLDEPTDAESFEEVRWFLMHEGVSVFVSDGQWYLSMATQCKHLTEESQCQRYETRPQICREYSSDSCDYRCGDYEYDEFFTHPEQIVEYANLVSGSKKGPGKKGKGRRKVSAHTGGKGDAGKKP